MCLYPFFIKNRKYEPNKKNGGNVPQIKDKRTEYVPIGCGNCIECRKQKAREWQVRLYEEIKIHKYKYFVTLTFSNENLKKLCNEANMTECNAVAGIAIRRFLERYRKRYKKSIKHWLITELGHDNTERIHLHGILFAEHEITIEELNELWKYGFADNGKYVNDRTINYIIKYVTKVDEDHKDFKPYIFCSAGLGKNYLNEFNTTAHRFNGKETKQYYTTPSGSKISLPIYYRNKLWTEEEREKLWLYQLDENTIYVRSIPCKVDTIENQKIYNRVLTEQQRENEAMGFGNRNKEWQKKDYNVTLRMLNEKPTLQNKRKRTKT